MSEQSDNNKPVAPNESQDSKPTQIAGIQTPGDTNQQALTLEEMVKQFNQLQVDNKALRDALETSKPAPNYPSMEMPAPPEVPGADPNVPKPDCEGQVIVNPDAKTSDVPPPPEGVARILLGIPMLDIKYEFFESFLKLWTEINLSNEKRYEVGYHIAYRKPVHMAEEYLATVAQYNKCTHLLLMDDDIYDVTKADIDKLFEADRDVIGGVMHASKFPHAMCVFRRYDTNKKVIDMPADNSIYRLYEVPCACTKCNSPLSHWDAKYCVLCGEEQDNLIQQADLIPFALTLIKMSVFDKIKKPWFHCTTTYPTDSWFADRLIEAGMTEYGHMGVRLNHAGITDETKPHFIQMGMVKAQKAKGIVQLSPDQMEAHQHLLVNRMKEVEESQKPRPTFGRDGEQAANALAADRDELTLITHGT